MARLEFYTKIMGNDIFASEMHKETQYQILRHEYQEILELYHEVLEYRKMSCATDEEIKGEIEHLIKLLTPVVQMEPHHRLFQEIANGDNITTIPNNTIKVSTVEVGQSMNESATTTLPLHDSATSSNSNNSNNSTSNNTSDNNGCTLA